MRRTILSGAILAILAFCLAGIHVASVADEVEDPTEELLKATPVTTGGQNVEQADEAEQQIAEPLDDAQRIEAMLKAIREIEKQHNIDEHALQFTEQVQKWLAEEEEEPEINEFQRRVAEQRERLSHPDFRPQAKKLLAAALRIRLMGIAAENLKAAEMHELARQVMEKADAMEHELREAKKQLAKSMHEAQADRQENESDIVQELRDEIERLRKEVRELQQKIEK